MSETRISEGDGGAAPDSVDEAFAAAAALQRQRAFAEAAAGYRALADRVVTVNLATNLGLCLSESGEFDEAERWLMLAARHRPNNAELRRLLGNLYTEIGQLERAELEYRTALAFQPDHSASLGLAGLLLGQGRYAEGWPLMEARVALHPEVVPPINVSFPEWRGEPLAGKSILVWYEQGFGDQIQFARFAQSLKARGAAHVALGCRPALVELFKTATGVDEVVAVPRGEAVSIRPYDYWSRYLSLPAALGVTVETIPNAPYLHAIEPWPPLGEGFKVGLKTEGSPTHNNDANRSLPAPATRRLRDLPVGVIDLDPAATGARDFADTAAIIDQLDLVISIDTSVAHLAGAMGKPCWTLLPRLHCDWRWLRERADSPWYPTMRLFRQSRPFDWEPVIDRVERELKDWLAAP